MDGGAGVFINDAPFVEDTGTSDDDAGFVDAAGALAHVAVVFVDHADIEGFDDDDAGFDDDDAGFVDAVDAAEGFVHVAADNVAGAFAHVASDDEDDAKFVDAAGALAPVAAVFVDDPNVVKFVDGTGGFDDVAAVDEARESVSGA